MRRRQEGPAQLEESRLRLQRWPLWHLLWPGVIGWSSPLLLLLLLVVVGAVRAAALGTIHSVTMVTRKPPKSLVKAEHVVRNGIALAALDAPLKIFEGSAREGAIAFPANVNVAAALGLAGIGPDRTRLEIWADPALERNTHFITVDADSARFTLSIENVPTDENPGTGRITALSVIAALRALVTPLHIGT